MTTPSKYVVRTGQIDGLEIKPFRDDLIKQAKEKGRDMFGMPFIIEPIWLEPPHAWWPALAPLTKDERLKVIADLTAEADKKKTPAVDTSTPL